MKIPVFGAQMGTNQLNGASMDLATIREVLRAGFGAIVPSASAVNQPTEAGPCGIFTLSD